MISKNCILFNNFIYSGISTASSLSYSSSSYSSSGNSTVSTLKSSGSGVEVVVYLVIYFVERVYFVVGLYFVVYLEVYDVVWFYIVKYKNSK